MPADAPRGPWFAAADLVVRAAARLAPAHLRADWRREWRAELWHEHARLRTASPGAALAGPRLFRSALGALADGFVSRRLYRSGAGPHPLVFQVSDMRQQLRFAVRSLRRAPGFTLVAVLTLGLGIGAAAAVYTLLDAVVLEPLPYPAAERLVRLDHPAPGYAEGEAWDLSVAGYFAAAEHVPALEEVGAFLPMGMTVGGSGPAERVQAALATPSLLGVLGATAARGRLFTDDDGREGAPPVALLGHAFWQRHFGGDPGVVGRRVRVNAEEHEVVGVLPPGFSLPDQPVDLWLPWALDAAAPARNEHYLRVLARTGPGVTPAEASARFAALTASFTERFPEAYDGAFMEEYGFQGRATPLVADVVGGLADTLWILLAAVGLVLAVACGNVLNLFVVRTEARRRDVAVRRALGAGPAALARHFLAEGVVLAAAGGVAGAALAWLGLRATVALAPPSLPRLDAVALDGSGAAFVTAVSLAVAALLTAVPLGHLRASASAEALADGGRGGTAGRRRVRGRRVLAAAQVALALVLLAGAGLLLESFRQLRASDPGFRAEGVLAVDVTIPSELYAEAGPAAAFHHRLVRALEERPEIERAAVTGSLPLVEEEPCYPVAGEGSARSGEACTPMVYASAGYFDVLGIRLEAGRAPSDAEDDARAGAVVVSRALAEAEWPGEDPVGRRMAFASGPMEYRVVGVAADVRTHGVENAAPPIAYFPLAPVEGGRSWVGVRVATVVLRTSLADPAGLTALVRETVAALDPDAAVSNVRSMEAVVAASMVRTSFAAALLLAAALMGVVLGVVGLYGLLAYQVGQRRREFGIRMALGAPAGEVGGMVLREAALLAGLGVAGGLAGALLAGGTLRGLLYGVRPADPLVLGGVAVLLFGVALAASGIPALRAARVDPAGALRAEG